ncbi:MAG TPA: hypothetical protein VGU61_00920 [Noviherbaspirillum sp.]|nr:hypothetical protein [Noviherbaspirillum sp.]
MAFLHRTDGTPARSRAARTQLEAYSSLAWEDTTAVAVTGARDNVTVKTVNGNTYQGRAGQADRALCGFRRNARGAGSASIQAMKERLQILLPDDDMAILSDAGFQNIEQFHAGFTFKGWAGYKD